MSPVHSSANLSLSMMWVWATGRFLMQLTLNPLCYFTYLCHPPPFLSVVAICFSFHHMGYHFALLAPCGFCLLTHNFYLFIFIFVSSFTNKLKAYRKFYLLLKYELKRAASWLQFSISMMLFTFTPDTACERAWVLESIWNPLARFAQVFLM